MGATDKFETVKMDPETCGIRDDRFHGRVHHYRGIPYATVSERFAKPTLATDWRDNGRNFKEYGAQCPQPAFPFEAMMGLPASGKRSVPDEENEFTCCNLNVSCPTMTTEAQCPVFVWIHGGGQAVSFPSAQHRLGDPGPLVAQSVEMNKPLILVTVNYRLNIFGFGDPEGINVNLDLQDLATAVRWVQGYIHLFGGDSGNITIGGQSAGAIYTHGLLAMGAQPKRAIMASGSLYLTPPRDRVRCLELLRSIEQSLRSKRPPGGAQREGGGSSLLRQTPARDMVKLFEEAKSYSWWMFEAPIGNWRDDCKVFSNVEAVLLSDCKEEGVPYDQQLRRSTKKEILDSFQSLPEPEYTALLSAYGVHVDESDYETCVTMARNFVTDARYALWSREIWNRINSNNGNAYLCQYDEVNPFAPWPTLGYPVAHHAVDLLAMFGGYDAEVNEATKEAGRLLRGKWIDFINGEEPWASDMIYCLGPDGKNGPLPAAEERDVDGTGMRRRHTVLDILKQIGLDPLCRVWQQLLPSFEAVTGSTIS